VSALTLGLSPKQAGVVLFLGTFVTIIGAALLALYLRRRNRKAAA
jgi:hypothetical protein